MLLRTLFTLLLGSLGGLLFAAVHSPLPWLLGALVTTVVCTFIGVQNMWIPRWFRQIGLIVIGISLGLRMTPEIWGTMTGHIGLMLIATILTVLISLGNAWIFYKVGKVEGITAIFSNIPGGLSEMVTIGQSVGGNQQVISIFHSLRAVTIVLCTPFIVMWLPHHASIQSVSGAHVLGFSQTLIILAVGVIGAWIASRCSIPAPFLLGALLLTALVSMNTSLTGESPALTGFLVKAAQVFVGVSIGLGFKREDIARNRRFFLFGLMHSVLLFVMVIVLAVGISYATDTDVLTNILATAPGGIAEMSLTALTIGADPLLVTAFQLFRVLFVLTLFSFGVRTWVNRHRRTRELQEAGQGSG
ncbi:AbrB family transcriptional regulator [Brevibacillus choshinensis]|uniref:AbrB family transcriptional regulator n=1 Tax=Brevibacillus choshinensis TaxID=54911 RepID=A0ABR5N2K4_BRECH|nr:AbrB family transcriptional regulator [Brevibacillus choshinensis]KQL44691.1 AbrB family transcriptional regulator [Brevibacillus choshinensis]